VAAGKTALPKKAPPENPSVPMNPAGDRLLYNNCAEARAAGKTPLYRGDPGYHSKLDRDRDGIACE